MAFTKIEIISSAIELLGKGPVVDVAQDTQFAIAEKQFDLLHASQLSKNDWRFATKIQQLSLEVAPPPSNLWKYSFSLPGDYLALRRLIPYTTDFNIYAEGKLYANQRTLTMEYRFAIAPERWPLYFVDYFRCELAEMLALAVARSETYAAEMRLLRKEKMASALAADAQSHPNMGIASAPFIDARFNDNRGYPYGGCGFGW